MALKCEKCGCADTTTELDTHRCLECGHQTKTGTKAKK